MKILIRYFIMQFIKPFLFGLASFIMIMAISELFEKLDTFTGMQAHPYDILLYLAYRIPDWTVQVLPVAVLLGSLFSLNKLLLSGEITAVKASGIPVQTVLYPILIFGIGISLAVFIFQETLMPDFNTKARAVYRMKIRRLPKENTTRWDRIVLSGKGNIRITAEELNLTRGYLKRVVVDQFKDISLVKQIDAKEAVWEGTRWKFINGVERWFSEDGKHIVKEVAFQYKLIDIYNSPHDLAPRRIKSKEMNIRKLARYIKHLQKLGIPNIREKVELNMKISFPFANFIILLIGIPFALYTTKGSGKFVSFGFALAVAFAYWGMISIGQSLGNARIFSPPFAAWFANIIFGIPGIYFFRKIKT